MDHLTECSRLPGRVPILEGAANDECDFVDFSSRCSYNRQNLSDNALRTRIKLDKERCVFPDRQRKLYAHSVVRRWLFFGLLKEVGDQLGISINRAKCTKENR